jgi:seryl-tRNA synthetase
MELILRSKEKEKDGITDYLGKMTVEERAIENLLKKNKLEQWGIGQQKGLHTYDTTTYDQERDDLEKMAMNEARLNKRSVVTDMNRDIFRLEMLEDDTVNAAQDKEDNMITNRGEDDDPEEYGMDGDENYDY